MATLVCVTWLPRSYIHLFKTHAGLNELSLKVSDVDFQDSLSFNINGYGDYPVIYFNQGWSGLTSFSVEAPDEGVYDTALQFMRDMQELLMNEIFKKCYPTTYLEITSDIVPLDFHVVIMSKNKIPIPKNFVERKAGPVTVAFDPAEVYSPGTVSYVNSEDAGIKKVLLYHAYTEVASSFMMNMLKRMTRQYHEADDAVKSVDTLEDAKALKDSVIVIDNVLKNCSQSFGKLKQACRNLNLKLHEYRKQKWSESEKALADALMVEHSFERLIMDAEYMQVWWEDVLLAYIKNIDSTLDARLMLHVQQKKTGLFG
jgi:hypothetical protein